MAALNVPFREDKKVPLLSMNSYREAEKGGYMNSVKEIPETTTKSKKKAGMNKKDPMQGF